ncbi:mitochondrial inner membrane protease ATP23-like [Aristolochia californica]|uniref:mitochondrial inner membrane protease ATP23-like n=1 Tax=Aristolochia californica TaxID=171875 RepID=UPI0035DF9817
MRGGLAGGQAEEESVSSSSGYSAKTVEECQYMINKRLKTPTVRFLREHLEKAGCIVGKNFIKPVNWTAFIRLMFSTVWRTPSLYATETVLCCSHDIADGAMELFGHRLLALYTFWGAMELPDGIAAGFGLGHELIHAYDDCRAKNLDWSICVHHACSEVTLSLTLSPTNMEKHNKSSIFTFVYLYSYS